MYDLSECRFEEEHPTGPPTQVSFPDSDEEGRGSAGRRGLLSVPFRTTYPVPYDSWDMDADRSARNHSTNEGNATLSVIRTNGFTGLSTCHPPRLEPAVEL